MSEKLKFDRRRFLSAAAITLAAGPLVMLGSADAASSNEKSVKKHIINAGNNIAFDTIKQIDAGKLNIGYVDVGPADGEVVFLLHGWPYDIHSFAAVAPLLAAQGYRVIVPHLRGHGTTRFLSDSTPRNGQQSVVAADMINLMDALKIK